MNQRKPEKRRTHGDARNKTGRHGGTARPGESGPPAPPLGDAARDLVIRKLAQQARRWPEMGPAELDTAGLDPRDAALAHAIYDAAVRRWLTLSYLLDRCLSQPFAELEAKMQAVLLAGAAQLVLLDRVPAHAAINQGVEWAKRRIRPGAGGMVNAVLRKVAAMRAERAAEGGEQERRERHEWRRDELPASEGGAIALSGELLPEEELELLSIATSTPRTLLEAWLRREPMHRVREMALHGLALPPVILNTAYATAPLPGPDVLEPHAAPGHHVFKGSHSELVSLIGSRSDIWVQDPASSLAVGSVTDLRPGIVIDLCAGQGTKTRQLAATFPDAKIVATDIDEARYATLAKVWAGSERVSALPFRTVHEAYIDKADLILLDVPCSNTGVLSRRPEAKYRFGPKTMESLVSVQKQIIADAIPLLRGGPGTSKILYSTCSLEGEENEKQAAWAARWHRFGVSRDHRRLPAGGPGEPDHAYSDGSFAALLG